MVKLLWIPALLALLLIGPLTTASAQGGTESAQEAVANMWAGWNLGNALDTFGLEEGTPQEHETYWGNPAITPELFLALKEAGFGAVRIPVTWDQKMDEAHQVDPAWMDRVAEVVDMALDADLYCIINVHHDAGSGDRWLRADPSAQKDICAQFAKLWTQIATRFRSYGERLLFEGMNEITDVYASPAYAGMYGGTPEEIEAAYQVVNELNQIFVAAVRTTGGRNAARNLICTPYYASIAPQALAKFEMPTDTVDGHLILSIHTYHPIEMSFHSVAEGTSITRLDWKAQIEYKLIFEGLSNTITSRGIPLIIGEFGAEDKGNTQERAELARYIKAKTREIGGVAFWWDNGNEGEFLLLDRESCTWAFPEIVEAMVK